MCSVKSFAKTDFCFALCCPYDKHEYKRLNDICVCVCLCALSSFNSWFLKFIFFYFARHLIFACASAHRISFIYRLSFSLFRSAHFYITRLFLLNRLIDTKCATLSLCVLVANSRNLQSQAKIIATIWNLNTQTIFETAF